MRKLWVILSTLILSSSLTGCDETKNLQDQSAVEKTSDTQSSRPETPSSESQPRAPINAEFRDVLNEFMGLNERLDRISARLKSANADLCESTEADVGLSVHTLNDYPAELRPAARHYLNVGPDLSIRTVRAGSSAQRSGLLAGDKLTHINRESLTDGPLFSDPQLGGQIAKAAFHKALDKTLENESAAIHFRRGKQALSSELSVTRQCKLPVTLFFNESINGHYIDGEIWMTSDDMKGRHDTDARTPEIELNADRIGLILLARAGYDPATLASFWAQQIDLFDGGNIASESHPDLKRRADNYALTLSYIRAARGDKAKLKALIFSSN